MLTWINSNYGVVSKLLDGGNRIEVRLPRGGRFTCRNRGFEVGEEVCFALDPSKALITSILHKEVADLKVALAQEPYARLDVEDDTYANPEDDLFSDGQEIEGLFDNSRKEFGEGPSEWEHHSDDPLSDEDGDWDDDYGYDAPDPPGETGDNEVYLFDGWDEIPELVDDDPTLY